MQAVADDLQRANRSIAAVKLPGGSNTAQDTFAVGKHDTAGSALMKIVLASGGGAGDRRRFLAVRSAARPRRSAREPSRRSGRPGLQKVDDLVRDAMLDPTIARALLAKAPERGDTGSYAFLAQRYRRAALAGAGTPPNRGRPVQTAAARHGADASGRCIAGSSTSIMAGAR